MGVRGRRRDDAGHLQLVAIELHRLSHRVGAGEILRRQARGEQHCAGSVEGRRAAHQRKAEHVEEAVIGEQHVRFHAALRAVLDDPIPVAHAHGGLHLRVVGR